MDKQTFKLDGQDVPFTPGQTVLESALSAGIFIPHLCHHKDLPDIGGCGLCVVSIDGETVRSCLTEAKEGMSVVSKSEELDHIRTIAMQLMLAGHIDDCNSCPKYLKCEFQMLIQQQGATVGDMRSTARGRVANLANPLIVRDLERCVACGRCVRVCHDIRKIGALTYTNDEKERKIVETKSENGLRDSDCRFCGACVEICPTGALRDKDGVFAENFCKGDMLVPCSYECPAHLDIPEYIRFIKCGDYLHAYEKIMEKAPFPRSLGNICMKFCENKCRRQYIDEPVSICSLKRFAGVESSDEVKNDFHPKASNGKSVGIVGAGPTGLTAAWLLGMKGYSVTVFESMPEAGGMMRYGMPEYRLSTDELNADISSILSIGNIDLKLSTPVDSMDVLKGFDAVIWATGAQTGSTLPIEGADSEGVLVGLDFLRAVRCGESPAIGKNVIVLGGGDVAYDCARTAIRLGAEAGVCCVEPEEKMTCTHHEKTDGAVEGVSVYSGRTFERILSKDGRVTGIECCNVKSFEFDENGRLKIEKQEDSLHEIMCDTIIFAVGQKVNIPEFAGIETDAKGRAVYEASSLEKTVILPAGDAVTSTSSVVQAVAWGQKAASDVDRYLGGDGQVIPEIAPKQIKIADISKNDFFNSGRNDGDAIPGDVRCKLFKPYVSPLDADEALKQSSRCLQCDLRKEISRARLYSEFAFKKGAGND